MYESESLRLKRTVHSRIPRLNNYRGTEFEVGAFLAECAAWKKLNNGNYDYDGAMWVIHDFEESVTRTLWIRELCRGRVRGALRVMRDSLSKKQLKDEEFAAFLAFMKYPQLERYTYRHRISEAGLTRLMHRIGFDYVVQTKRFPNSTVMYVLPTAIAEIFLALFLPVNNGFGMVWSNHLWVFFKCWGPTLLYPIKLIAKATKPMRIRKAVDFLVQNGYLIQKRYR